MDGMGVTPNGWFTILMDYPTKMDDDWGYLHYRTLQVFFFVEVGHDEGSRNWRDWVPQRVFLPQRLELFSGVQGDWRNNESKIHNNTHIQKSRGRVLGARLVETSILELLTSQQPEFSPPLCFKASGPVRMDASSAAFKFKF